MISHKIDILKKRSDALHKLRAFFYAQNVTEVDTPILSRAAVPDVHLASLQTSVDLPNVGQQLTYYLHTSSEYPMKRLLCEGIGDIYYLGKVFRNGDLSPRHQPEFTMIEWYRLNYRLKDMVEETFAVAQQLLGDVPTQVMTYQQAFERFAGIADIHHTSAEVCLNCLKQNNVPEIIGVDADDKPLWEQLVLTEVIEPLLGLGQLTCLTHFPARDASLARISPDNDLTAERFEIFYQGMELANGYHELQDADAYRQRFEANQALRRQNGLAEVPIDEALLDALSSPGLPDCSGVAMGFDRLFALSQGKQDLSDVLAFGALDA
ncbi:EF-P lysine aminoacylase EpmA [Hydrogenovibrio sp. JE_KL2]|uniref:EF-P lysine aminoacylase EpmA n=1 Tax=Hydrogenovibrio sp. JE_KL2 TaxID=2651188 RepID=UPI0013542C8F|nr:EF-P lysine aminoacylase GenX [Hydrogenovibrio sp. JE_KL2]